MSSRDNSSFISRKAPESQGSTSPKILMRQQRLGVAPELDGDAVMGASDCVAGPSQLPPKSKPSRWVPRLSNRHSSTATGASASQDKTSWARILSQKMARLSSLDSTKSGSSLEAEHSGTSQVVPVISITGNMTNDQQQHQSSRSSSSTRTAFNFGHPLETFGGHGIAEEELPDDDQPSGSSYRADTSSHSKHHHQDQGSKRQNFRLAGRTATMGSSYMDADDDDDDDDDAFQDAPLPIPYSCSRFAHEESTNDLYRYYEDLLDDRQGMNNNEYEQFTKGEQQAASGRPSIDGSIASGLRLPTLDPNHKDSMSGRGMVSDGSGGDANKSGTLKLDLSGGTGGGQTGGQTSNRGGKSDSKRSKSPSSSSMLSGPMGLQRYQRQSRQSRRGLFGLASRLKLTKKHESIEKFQLSILNSGFLSLKTLDRDLQSFLPKERMSPQEFEMRVKLMRKYPVLAKIEYKFASRYETYVSRQALHEMNLIKNNYKKCIPYDYNRVVLKTLPGKLHSDYVNASHVDSILKPNAYIAAQGPNENTIEDFWRMVWEQKTFVIVMLTKVFDFIRVMCNQYWPVELNKPECYGNLEVTLLYEEPLADFVIRTIKLVKLNSNGNNNGKATADSKQQDQASGSASRKPTSSGANMQEDEGAISEAGLSGGEGDSFGDDSSLAGLGGSFSFPSGQPDIVIVNDDGATDEGANDSQRLKVRAPKFVVAPGGSRSLRGSRSPSVASVAASSLGEQHRPTSAPPQNNEAIGRAKTILERRANRNLLDDQTSVSCKDLLLDPQAAATGRQTGNSQLLLQCPSPSVSLSLSQLQLNTNSMSSLVSAPPTPLSSTGLDRSSATRRPVKKKRRIRVKNARPLSTQFRVPDESQLADDTDDDPMQGGGSAGGASGRGTGGTVASNERIVYQFHYNSWASHTCPFISSLLHFRRRVRICMDEMSKSGKTGPTIVHCNDGCGRTGAYLCIDANLELVEEDNVYDVYNYTKKLRQSRKFLIENLEQYKFVYDTIEEALYCGKTWFPVSELHKRLKHKSQRNPITKKNEYLVEYEKITRMTSKFSIGDCAGGHRVENREKNRDVSTVPPDNFRPYLSSFQTNDSTDYINAVFVDGYTRSKEYIVTEWPLLRTISDFWSLVYDHDCNSVILLANPSESSTYPSFLPSEKELRRKFGPVFSAEMVSYTHYQNIKSWIYTINKKIVSLTEVIAGVKSEAKTTQVFQITCWPQGHRVPTSTNALVELMNMVERWRQRTAYGPVCVVSLDGKSRAGVYCAANVAIEQVVQHGEVDVFQAVKTVRRHRPQLIENMTEYKYCYDLILHYVLHYLNQPNSAT